MRVAALQERHTGIGCLSGKMQTTSSYTAALSLHRGSIRCARSLTRDVAFRGPFSLFRNRRTAGRLVPLLVLLPGGTASRFGAFGFFPCRGMSDAPDIPTPWQRIERVLEVAGMSANRLARHLGLPRGENLYQIKRGNNNIIRDVAVRIHSKFPQFSLLWLLTGWGVGEQRENELAALTLYDDLTDLEAGIPSRITLPRQEGGEVPRSPCGRGTSRSVRRFTAPSCFCAATRPTKNPYTATCMWWNGPIGGWCAHFAGTRGRGWSSCALRRTASAR